MKKSKLYVECFVSQPLQFSPMSLAFLFLSVSDTSDRSRLHRVRLSMYSEDRFGSVSHHGKKVHEEHFAEVPGELQQIKFKGVVPSSRLPLFAFSRRFGIEGEGPTCSHPSLTLIAGRAHHAQLGKNGMHKGICLEPARAFCTVVVPLKQKNPKHNVLARFKCFLLDLHCRSLQ